MFADVFEHIKETGVFKSWEYRGSVPFEKIKGLQKARAFSHKGEYHYFLNRKKPISLCFQSGRLHGYEGLNPEQIASCVCGPRLAGTKRFVLTNISGSLHPQRKVGTVTAVTDHINLTGQSPLTGLRFASPPPELSNPLSNTSRYFVDMTRAYDSLDTQKLTGLMKALGLKVLNGVYAGVSGPQLETPAEIRAFKTLGGDVVGMSLVQEVTALCYLKARVSAFSLVSNLAAGVGQSVSISAPSLKPAIEKMIKSFVQFAQPEV